MKLIPLFLGIILSFSNVAQAETINISTQLETLINSITSMQADFEQVVKQNGRVVAKTTGSVAMQKPGQFVWNTQAPYQQQLYIKDKRIWVYEPALKQATLKNLDEASESMPAVFLSGYDKRLSTYYKMQVIEGEQNTVGYQLTTKNINADLDYIYLRFQGQKLLQMYVTDRLGQSIEIIFSNLQVNETLAPELFQFSLPADVDIIYGT